MNTFAIGIPTLNRYDLLSESLTEYLMFDFPNTHIFLLDNGNQAIGIKHKNLTILRSNDNLGVSASWNVLISLIIGSNSHAFLLNDDVYSGKNEAEISALINKNGEEDFFVSYHNWASFIVPKKTYERVGQFDVNFYPAYFEDNDYHYRMKQLNMTYYRTDELNCKVFRNSMTIEKSPDVNKNFEKNKSYYVSKWGGEPGEETFKYPFNNVKQ